MLNTNAKGIEEFEFFFYLAGFGSALWLRNDLHCDNSISFSLQGKTGPGESRVVIKHR